MERFFTGSKDDADKMQAALEGKDFDVLKRLGHTAKGTGHGYGFSGMGQIGLALEGAAKAEDCEECQAQIDRMRHYLDTVKVEFKN